jgi:hypothetical protein
VRSLERRRAAAAEGVDSNEGCYVSACPRSEITQITATAAVPLLILHVGPHPCSFKRSGECAGALFLLKPAIASGVVRLTVAISFGSIRTETQGWT